MTTTADLAEALVRKIAVQAKELTAQGVKTEPFGMAVGAILGGQMIKALVRIESLENELKRLSSLISVVEERGLKYCGTWQRAQDYQRGDSVTHKGSLWTAIRTTNKAPDQGSDWQLSAKGKH